MNVPVFGATSPTGRIVVARALEEGHTVTGFTRRPASLQGRHERLRPRAREVWLGLAPLLAEGETLDLLG